jgi:alkylhydroperoxidase family enzyme
MPWIRVVGEEESTGELKGIYQAQSEKAGALANILKTHSLAPRTLSTHMAFYESVMHAPGDLSRTRREMIAMVVSA